MKSILKKNYFLLLMFLIIITLFVGCPENNKDPQTQDDDNDLPIITAVTIKWEVNADGYTTFYTDDTLFNELNKGCTFWNPEKYTNITDNEFEAKLIKISGKFAYGYGIVFCIQEDPDLTGNLTAENFYSLMIRADGYMQIIKVVDREQHRMEIPDCDKDFWAIPEDTDGNNLLKIGLNQANYVKVKSKDTNNNNLPEFDIYINNELIYSFEDNFVDDNGTELPLFDYSTGLDKYGFIVTVGPTEDFPDKPVDVRFKQESY